MAIATSKAKVPAGILAISEACSELYPKQTNPRQVATKLKYWLGGPDPLDYISIYWNEGTEHSTAHWHYISYGLSDLYRDGRVHREAGGFGFELTFRLVWSDDCPPSWPAELLQSIARYLFSSGSTLCAGDHISWHNALDGGESIIQHLLLCEDPQLSPLTTRHKALSFLQLVGVCAEELKAAQWWNCPGVISLLSMHKITGGPLLVTDMRRGEALFDVDSSAQESVDKGMSTEGSTLSGVNALCLWRGAKSHTLESDTPHSLDRVRVELSAEALSLLPMVFRTRLTHGRHFTFKSFTEELAVTFVSAGVEGAFSTERQPLTACGSWLQIYLTQKHSQELKQGVGELLSLKEQSKRELELPDIALVLCVLIE